jgi:hypothetical protein
MHSKITVTYNVTLRERLKTGINQLPLRIVGFTARLQGRPTRYPIWMFFPTRYDPSANNTSLLLRRQLDFVLCLEH